MIRTHPPFAFLLTVSLGALCLSAGAPAQQTETDPAAKQPPAEQQDAAGQDDTEGQRKLPEKQDPVAAARATLQAVENELRFVRRIAEQGLPQRVQDLFLSERELQTSSIDLGIEAAPDAAAAGAQPPKQVGVRLMTEQELEQAADDVVFLVDGQAVTRSEYDAMLDHLLADPGDSSRAALEKEAVKSLAMQKAALAAFAEQAPEARAEIEQIQRKLEEGADFADVAREDSQCPSAARGGDLDFIERGVMDPIFERAAWQLPVGEVSDIVQSAFGYHLIKVVDREVGEQPGQIERVRPHHILVMFDDDAGQVRKVMSHAAQGRVDLAFVDAEWREKSPF